jgi:uncharacterized protein with HEPN domain
MIEAAETARQFIAGRQRSALDENRMLLFALVRAIEVIGEAASKVLLETRTATPSVPWPAIIAMRNRLVHAYFDIDRDILWRTVSEEVPALVSLLSSSLLTED